MEVLWIFVVIDGNLVDLCRNYFKIVTKGISDESYNILDISDISVVNIRNRMKHGSNLDQKEM